MPDLERDGKPKGVDIRARDYITWLITLDGKVVHDMQEAGISGWVADGTLDFGVLQDMSISGAIPMRPGDTNSAEDRQARKELDQWMREWKVPVTHILVWNERDANGWLHAPVPLWMLRDVPSEQIRSFYYEKTFAGNPQAISYHVAYIAMTGQPPGTGPNV